MNNFKNIINEGTDTDKYLYIGMILRVCLLPYTIAYTYIFYNKRVFKCKITSSPYLSTLLKCEVLRLKGIQRQVIVL